MKIQVLFWRRYFDRPSKDNPEILTVGQDWELRFQTWKMRYFPHRLTEMNLDSNDPMCTGHWYWRGRTLWTYQTDNIFYGIDIDSEDEDEL